jgi:hypothetical protein
MPLRKVEVTLIDNNGTLCGTVVSPDLFRTVAFEYQEWRDNIVMFDGPKEKGLYQKPLAWLDPMDAHEVYNHIDRAVKDHQKLLAGAKNEQ